MTRTEENEILTEIKKTNSHISDIYNRIDGLKDNQFAMQQSLFDLSGKVLDNKTEDFKNNLEIQKQIQKVAKKHGSTAGKKWGAIGSVIAAAIALSFKAWEYFTKG